MKLAIEISSARFSVDCLASPLGHLQRDDEITTPDWANSNQVGDA
jgi:hypothetical protein